MAAPDSLFPPLSPYNSGKIRVSPIHEIYYEECGNPAGRPAVFLHGGPGSGCSPEHRRFFDPKHYRIVLLDQRGCGRSTPFAEVKENSTWDLVADLETLRTLLKIDRWLVFGGSWGSTLALAYATKHPQVISGLILRGIFLCRPEDLYWFYQSGASFIFPEAWEKYLEPIPQSERGDLMQAYHKRLMGSDPKLQREAAIAWSVWEASTSKLLFDSDFISRFAEPQFALSFARIENHYFVNKVFFPTPNYLLEQAPQYRNIPGVIVHGRYDMVCPIDGAHQLKKAWPKADLQIIPDCGHSVFEPGICEAVVAATEKFKSL